MSLLDQSLIDIFIEDYTNSSSSYEAMQVLKHFLDDNKINLNLLLSSIIKDNLNKLYYSMQISTLKSPSISCVSLFEHIPIENMYKNETYNLVNDSGTAYDGLIYRINV
jgi:hypothetical protein